MDTECAVCYCEQATCKLVCNHTFCKSCVKTWYQTSGDEPTCPMCRHTLYFKGLHKISEKWEEEKINKLNEDAFNAAFEKIFEDSDSDSDYSDSESDSDSDSGSDSWETWEESESPLPPRFISSESSGSFSSFKVSKEVTNSDYFIMSIIRLQKAYQKALKNAIDITGYLDDDNYLEYDIDEENSQIYDLEDDIFPHERNLFVSNHKNMVQNKQKCVRVPSNNDMSFTLIILVACL